MASKPGTRDEESEYQGLVASTKSQNAVLAPVRVAVSKPARRAYLTTLLATFGSLILLGLAITAYILFYWSYIPPIGFEKELHLQFDYVSSPRLAAAAAAAANDAANVVNPHPHATVNLSPDLVSQQRYDVSIELSLPRTRENRDAGNFMLEATMFAPEAVIVDALKETLSSTPGAAEEDSKLAVSRRSGMLKYRSTPVEILWKLTELHWYLLKFREEAEKVRVKMFEGVEFAKGWRNLPGTMKVEVQSTHRLQIYSAKAVFRARFKGLRWLMYNHRIITAFVSIMGFWGTEMVFMGLAWAALSLYFGGSADEVENEKVKREDQPVKKGDQDDEKPILSDTERTFPTTSRQTPLRYESPTIKQEDGDDTVVIPEAATRATEADDEDEDDDADVFRDSGLGTSLESSGGQRDSVRRRRSRTGAGEEFK